MALCWGAQPSPRTGHCATRGAGAQGVITRERGNKSVSPRFEACPRPTVCTQCRPRTPLEAQSLQQWSRAARTGGAWSYRSQPPGLPGARQMAEILREDLSCLHLREDARPSSICQPDLQYIDRARGGNVSWVAGEPAEREKCLDCCKRRKLHLGSTTRRSSSRLPVENYERRRHYSAVRRKNDRALGCIGSTG